MTSHHERSRDKHQPEPLDTGSTAPLRSIPMTGPELLEHAAGVVTRRRREYGEPVDVFDAIAKRWSSVLRMEVTPAQVVLALLDVKLVRLSANPKHLDSIVDVAGYAAVLREVTRDA
jgi:Domain of unknown function (DUF6378)